MDKKIGVVTHFFAGPSAAVLRLESQLKLGDAVHIVGATTDLNEKVTSMQIDHSDVENAWPGDDVAILVKDRVREGDEVFLVEAGAMEKAPSMSPVPAMPKPTVVPGGMPTPAAPKPVPTPAAPTPALPRTVTPMAAPKAAAPRPKAKAKVKAKAKPKAKPKVKAKPKKKDKPKSKSKSKAKAKPKKKDKSKKKKR